MGELDNLRGTLPSWWFMMGLAGSVFVSVLALLAFARDSFDGGYSASSVFATQVEQNRAAIDDLGEQADANIVEMREGFVLLLEAVEPQQVENGAGDQ